MKTLTLIIGQLAISIAADRYYLRDASTSKNGFDALIAHDHDEDFDCPPGTYASGSSDAGVAGSCQLCAAGTYSDSAGNTSCTPCVLKVRVD
ncbi:hypothetical protein ACHAXN_000238 [Cyclotella atomus]